MPYSNKTTPAWGRIINQLGRNGEPHHTCAQCEGLIVDGRWFGRLPGSGGAIMLCSPSCALQYFGRIRPRPRRNGTDHDWESYERQFHFLIVGEQPWS